MLADDEQTDDCAGEYAEKSSMAQKPRTKGQGRSKTMEAALDLSGSKVSKDTLTGIQGQCSGSDMDSAVNDDLKTRRKSRRRVQQLKSDIDDELNSADNQSIASNSGSESVTKVVIKKSAADAHKLSCDYCDETFENDRKLQVHVAVHSTMLFHCTACNHKCNNHSDIVKHLKNVHGYNFCCYYEHCVAGYNSANGLKQHMRNKHGTEPSYKCSKCGQIFKTANPRDKHEESCKVVQATEECLHCFNRFLDRDGLKSHLAEQHGLKKVLCERCQSEFNYLKALNDHQSKGLCESIVSKRRDTFLSVKREKN